MSAVSKGSLKKSKKINRTKTRRCKMIPTKFETRRIPESKFKNAQEMINDKNFLANPLLYLSCHGHFHHNLDTRHSSANSLSELVGKARICLLRRDWVNLAKLLTLVKPSEDPESYRYFPILVRYALICLAHNPDENLMDMFLQSVILCSGSSEKEIFLKGFFRPFTENKQN